MRLLWIPIALLAGCSHKSDEAKKVDKPASSYATCIDGTKSACTTILDAKWTESQCCFPDHMTCVEGKDHECRLESGGWTGTKCCFASYATCVAGKPDACKGDNGIWTGAQCCLPSTFTCAAGTLAECRDHGGKWTGEQCCQRAPK